jgi:hypothetical protein
MILLIGNCHIEIIKDALELATNQNIKIIRYDHALKKADNQNLLKELWNKASIVGCMTTFAEKVSEIRGLELDKMQLIPHIHSDAFHPDCCNLWVNNKRVESIMGLSHSAIIAYAYLNDIKRKDVIKLFDREIYDHLGYFDNKEKSILYAREQEYLTDWPVEEMYEIWFNKAPFVHTPNHSKHFVYCDIAMEFAKKNNIELIYSNPSELIFDRTTRSEIWPIYPEIAEKYNIKGSYEFKIPNIVKEKKSINSVALPLEKIIKYFYSTYKKYKKEEIKVPAIESDEFKSLNDKGLVDKCLKKSNKKNSNNPYKNIENYRFWKKSFEKVEKNKVDPVVHSKFRINVDDKLATAGSCFAQHISSTLEKSGFNYFAPESAPKDMDAEEAKKKNYGVFSARFGNIYSSRQLLQLFDRAFSNITADLKPIKLPNGNFSDPFRPFIEPDGFANEQELFSSCETHLSHVREMFTELDTFVFTLGLTEIWRSKNNGLVVPIVPSAVSEEANIEDYEFYNLTTYDVIEDLNNFQQKLHNINPKAKIIYTVSPVPLIATYENRHVLTSTIYSKSVLRVAADEIQKNQDNIMYFPSYEIITGNYNKGSYYENDLRSVRPEGVSHVMKLFKKHCTKQSFNLNKTKTPKPEGIDIVCDEEALEQ